MAIPETLAASTVQSIKLAIVSATGLAKDALHVYVGLAVLLIAAAALRKPLRSVVPWLSVLAVACAGELLDLRDDIVYLGHWRWATSLYDILNTLFWPTVIWLLARKGILFRASDNHDS